MPQRIELRSDLPDRSIYDALIEGLRVIFRVWKAKWEHFQFEHSPEGQREERLVVNVTQTEDFACPDELNGLQRLFWGLGPGSADLVSRVALLPRTRISRQSGAGCEDQQTDENSFHFASISWIATLARRPSRTDTSHSVAGCLKSYHPVRRFGQASEAAEPTREATQRAASLGPL